MSKRKIESDAPKILDRLLAEHNISRELYEILLSEEQDRVHLKKRRHIKGVLREKIENDGESQP